MYKIKHNQVESCLICLNVNFILPFLILNYAQIKDIKDWINKLDSVQKQMGHSKRNWGGILKPKNILTNIIIGHLRKSR